MAPADQPHRTTLRAPHPTPRQRAWRNLSRRCALPPACPHKTTPRRQSKGCRRGVGFRSPSAAALRPQRAGTRCAPTPLYIGHARRKKARPKCPTGTSAQEEGTREAPRGHKHEGRRHARSAPWAQVPGESARRATTPRRRRPLIGSPVRPAPRGQRLRAPPPRPRWPCGATPAPTPPWASDAARAAAPRR